jgi:hypothetical protein
MPFTFDRDIIELNRQFHNKMNFRDLTDKEYNVVYYHSYYCTAAWEFLAYISNIRDFREAVVIACHIKSDAQLINNQLTISRLCDEGNQPDRRIYPWIDRFVQAVTNGTFVSERMKRKVDVWVLLRRL